MLLGILFERKDELCTRKYSYCMTTEYDMSTLFFYQIYLCKNWLIELHTESLNWRIKFYVLKFDSYVCIQGQLATLLTQNPNGYVDFFCVSLMDVFKRGLYLVTPLYVRQYVWKGV